MILNATDGVTARPASLAVASLALAMLLASLGTSIANVALPTLAATFAVSFSAVQWVVIAYLLTTTAVVVGVGRLGDLHGPRRMLLFGLALFAVASVAGGLAPSLPFLIAARAAQGLGAAFMMALAVALVRATVGKERTGAAMGLLGTMSALGTALGPTLGGMLIGVAGWRMVFLAAVPVALLGFELARRHLPPDALPTAAREPFDRVGMAWLAIALGAGALAMTTGRDGLAPLPVGLALAALASALAFVRAEQRAAAPLIQLEMLRAPTLAAGLLLNGLVSAVMMATLVVGPFFLTRSLGLDAVGAGLVMSVGPLVAAAVGMPAGRLVDRIGARRMTQLGLAGVGVGATAIAVVAAWATPLGYLSAVALLTSSFALFQAANSTAVMADVAADRRGVVSGLLSLSRSLGLLTGAALFGAVFAVASGAPDAATASPAAAAVGMRVTFGVGAVLVGLAVVIGGLRDARARRS